MRRLLPLGLAVFLLSSGAGAASQARMEDDCARRLQPLAPRGARALGAGFSALGPYATYYVVTWRFDAVLAHGQRSATCTYRRDGQWVKDDAMAHQLARELDASPRR